MPWPSRARRLRRRRPPAGRRAGGPGRAVTAVGRLVSRRPSPSGPAVVATTTTAPAPRHALRVDHRAAPTTPTARAGAGRAHRPGQRRAGRGRLRARPRRPGRRHGHLRHLPGGGRGHAEDRVPAHARRRDDPVVRADRRARRRRRAARGARPARATAGVVVRRPKRHARRPAAKIRDVAAALGVPSAATSSWRLDASGRHRRGRGLAPRAASGRRGRRPVPARAASSSSSARAAASTPCWRRPAPSTSPPSSAWARPRS